MSPPEDNHEDNHEGDGAKPPVTEVAEAVDAEPVARADPQRFRHLSDNRSLIVKRALLSSALGGALPVPLLDDYFAARIRAGLLMKLATTRHVGLPEKAADVLAEAREGSTLRNTTMTAITLIALKLAWRKFFTILAAGRGAEEAAATYQSALLFDHYCARVHTGPDLTIEQAAVLRRAIHGAVTRASKDKLVGIFREGGRTLGRTLLQAPAWASEKVTGLFQRWILTRGNPDIDIEIPDAAAAASASPWLDRASQTVEHGIAALGNDYLGILVDHFETSWAETQEKAKQGDVPKEKGPDQETD